MLSNKIRILALLTCFIATLRKHESTRASLLFRVQESTRPVTCLWNREPLNVAYDTKLILDDQVGNILKPIQNPSDKPASVTGQVHF